MDLDLHKDTPSDVIEPGRAKPPLGPTIAIGLLVVAVGLAIYVVFGRKASAPGENTAAAPPPAQVKDEAVKPLGGNGDSITLPPLDETDPLVRELVARLSQHPRVAAWLTTRGLIRNFTLVVVNIADGKTPAAQLQAIRPASSFRIIAQDDNILIDSRSYERYDPLADAVRSLDAGGTARLYATLKPRIEEAYRDLGFPNASFDRTLERAIVSLLDTPVASGSIELEPRGGIAYAYADPALEELTGAQKQLLRMGPRNARIVHQKLREIAIALGIPAGRLPAQR